MARIQLNNVAHSYARHARTSTGTHAAGRGDDPIAWALKPMNVAWSDGGAYALLGPSGCGKTTLLNIISGLAMPTRGEVLFDGRDVTMLAPQERNIAQVFQFPVIYDTMTVFDNLAFPLRNRGWKSADMRKRVHEIAEILELTTDLPRRANGLSADAKQKISLGRGLVRPDVAAVLFDEPLTVIDPHVKWLLRRKLKQIHQQLKLSLIYVTHDQTEALTFADQVVVMTEGEIVQTGTPEQLFETPEHRFVGHFIGSPGMNFIDCTWQGSSALVHGTPVTTSSTTIPPPAASLTLGIRPEYVELCDSNGPNRLPAQITAVHDRGTYLMARVVVGDHPLWGKVHDVRRAPQLGEAIVHLPADKCALYADDRRLA